MNDKAAAYAALVGVDATAACGNVTTKRITASQPALSKLCLKVNPGANPPANCGGVMPPPGMGRTALTAEQFATIRGWIQAGALNN
jgi:hypothetical protein